VDDYGRGNAKTVHILLVNIKEGEATITIDGQNKNYPEVNIL